MNNDQIGALLLTVVVATALGLVIGVVGAQLEWFVALTSAPIVIAIGLKRPEWVLAGFLYAGAFKAVVPLPFDLTVVLAAGVLALSFVGILKHGLPRLDWAVWMFVAFAGLVVVGLLTGGVTDYGLEKATRFATLGLTAFLGTLAIVRDERGVLSFMDAAVLIGLVMAGYAVASGGAGSIYGRYVAFGSNTIALGRAAAFALAGAAVRAVWRPASIVWAGPVMVICLWALAGSGSRGPAVAALLAIAILVGYRMWTRGARTSVVVVFAAAMVSVAATAWTYLPRASTQRFEGVFSGALGQSEFSRITLFSRALSVIWRRPILGIGTGRFAEYAGGEDYAHNIVLEVWAENGLLGLGMLGLSLIAGFWRAILAAVRFPGVASDFVVVALILALVNALVSGDLNDNRLLYSLLAMGLSGAAAVKSVADEGVAK